MRRVVSKSDCPRTSCAARSVAPDSLSHVAVECRRQCHEMGGSPRRTHAGRRIRRARFFGLIGVRASFRSITSSNSVRPTSLESRAWRTLLLCALTATCFCTLTPSVRCSPPLSGRCCRQTWRTACANYRGVEWDLRSRNFGTQPSLVSFCLSGCFRKAVLE